MTIAAVANSVSAKEVRTSTLWEESWVQQWINEGNLSGSLDKILPSIDRDKVSPIELIMPLNLMMVERMAEASCEAEPGEPRTPKQLKLRRKVIVADWKAACAKLKTQKIPWLDVNAEDCEWLELGRPRYYVLCPPKEAEATLMVVKDAVLAQTEGGQHRSLRE